MVAFLFSRVLGFKPKMPIELSADELATVLASLEDAAFFRRMGDRAAVRMRRSRGLEAVPGAGTFAAKADDYEALRARLLKLNRGGG